MCHYVAATSWIQNVTQWSSYVVTHSVPIWGHTDVLKCGCVRINVEECLQLFTLSGFRPVLGRVPRRRQVPWQGDRGGLSIISASSLSIFWQSLALVRRPTSWPQPGCPFRAPGAGLLMHSPLFAAPCHLSSSYKLPWQCWTIALSLLFVKKLFQYVFLGTVMFA